MFNFAWSKRKFRFCKKSVFMLFAKDGVISLFINLLNQFEK